MSLCSVLFFKLTTKFLFLSNLLVKYFLFPARTIFAVIESENLTIVKMLGFCLGRTDIVLNLFQMCLLDITRSAPVSKGL